MAPDFESILIDLADFEFALPLLLLALRSKTTGVFRLSIFMLLIASL